MARHEFQKGHIPLSVPSYFHRGRADRLELGIPCGDERADRPYIACIHCRSVTWKGKKMREKHRERGFALLRLRCRIRRACRGRRVERFLKISEPASSAPHCCPRALHWILHCMLPLDDIRQPDPLSVGNLQERESLLSQGTLPCCARTRGRMGVRSKKIEFWSVSWFFFPSLFHRRVRLAPSRGLTQSIASWP